MKWYAAHAILYVRFKDGRQDCYVAWENVYLVSGDSPDTAERAVCERAKEAEGDSSGTFRIGHRPAEWVFAGVRN